MHPYKEFEGARLWAALDKTVSDLVGNQDLQEMTPREYIVGFLAQRLTAGGLLSPEALRTASDDADNK